MIEECWSWLLCFLWLVCRTSDSSHTVSHWWPSCCAVLLTAMSDTAIYQAQVMARLLGTERTSPTRKPSSVLSSEVSNCSCHVCTRPGCVSMVLPEILNPACYGSF